MKEKTERMLLAIGGLFAEQNIITSEVDTKITFEVNAEDCYWDARHWLEVKIAVSTLLLFSTIFLMASIKSIKFDLNSTVAIAVSSILYTTYINVFSRINHRKRLIVQMAKCWKPNRWRLLYLTRKFCDSTTISNFEDRDIQEALPNLLMSIAKAIAVDIVKEESLTGIQKHPELDKHKSILNLLAESFKIEIPWSEIFDDSIKAYGRRDKI